VRLHTFILSPYGCAIAEGKSAFYYTLKPSNCSHSEIFAVKASKLASLTQTENLALLAHDFLLEIPRNIVTAPRNLPNDQVISGSGANLIIMNYRRHDPTPL
jgi:hypothetical protein